MSSKYLGKTDKRFSTLIDIIYDTTNEFKGDDGKADEESRIRMIDDLISTLTMWRRDARPKKSWQFWK